MDGHKGADQHRTNTNSSNNSSTGNKGRGISKTRGKDDSSDKSRKKEGNPGGSGGTKQRVRKRINEPDFLILSLSLSYSRTIIHLVLHSLVVLM